MVKSIGMSPKKNYYITTTLPYVNSDPHIGFAFEIVAADVLARYHRLLGEAVIFNTGTDEHGQKIYQKAIENQQTPQAYVDEYASRFQQLKSDLDLSYDRFIRTTNPDHQQAAQEFWKRCAANGDIYKKDYQTKYCVGCELEKTDSELVEGKCPLHPSREIEYRQEENYFFAFSRYQQPLLDLYQKQPDFVLPESKHKEISTFVKNGLQDFSISRLKAKMPWGVPVPDDPDHVMYVWFDALVNYISTLGWPSDTTKFQQYWPAVQIAGKDNLRQQSAMWQAMLLSAGLSTSEQILINGFINVGGQKMSKDLGNVIKPGDLIERYGTQASRYLLMSLGPVGNDVDIDWQRLDEIYTAELVNGFGNLASRMLALVQKNQVWDLLPTQQPEPDFPRGIKTLFDQNRLNQITHNLTQQCQQLDQAIDQAQPWALEVKPAQKAILAIWPDFQTLLDSYRPIIPTVIKRLDKFIAQKNQTKLKPIFPRLNHD